MLNQQAIKFLPPIPDAPREPRRRWLLALLAAMALYGGAWLAGYHDAPIRVERPGPRRFPFAYRTRAK
jgi:hypothetical protein